MRGSHLSRCALLLLCARSVTSGNGPQRSCTHTLPSGVVYNLSAFRNTTIYGPKSTGGRFAQSLCGDLPIKCTDSLTGANLSGALFQYFGSGGTWHCWDVLVPSFNNPPDSSPLPIPKKGLTLTWAHRGDAHLACAEVVVSTSVVCDQNASVDPTRAILSGVQTRCTWNLVVKTASLSVCGVAEPATIKPTEIKTPAPSQNAGAQPLFLFSESTDDGLIDDVPPALLVHTKSNGLLYGGISDTGRTRYFLGIPYATSQRWKAPQPISSPENSAPGRAGVPRNATMFGPSCWQQGGVAVYPQSEHCLNLNVFAPASQHGERYPVLLWIHGGCYAYGTANQRIGNGTDLVEKFGDVIVVSINYRLSAFGFLASEELRSNKEESTGNYGIMDQREAMRWVQHNIEEFGGDRSRVMIFGQSAGAGSISNHLVSKKSWGLFSRAAMESGSFANWIAMSLHGAEKNWRALVRLAGCKLSSSSATVACMRALPAARLAKYSGSISVPCRDGCTFAPVVDGVTLTDYPWKLMEKESAPGVAVMHGTNLDDGLLFVNMSRTGSKKDLEFWLKKMYSGDPRMSDHYIRRKVKELYPEHEYPKDSPLSRSFWAADRVETDFAYACPAERTSSAFSSKNVAIPTWSEDAAVYQYRFAASASANGTVLHGDELPFVWLDGGHTSVAQRPELADTMASFWVNFAKMQNPNLGHALPSGTPKWPAWTRKKRYIMQFVAAKHHHAVVLKDGIDRKRCEELWTKNWDFFGKCLKCTVDDAGCN